MLDEYLCLIKNHPDLFTNKNAVIKVITDNHFLREASQAGAERGIGESEIGILVDDTYYVFLRDLVQFPDGSIGPYDRLIHKGQLTGNNSVVMLAKYQESIILLHIYRHATRSWHYEFPRGFAETGLSPIENVKKELREEINGEAGKILPLGTVHPDTGLCSNEVHLFYCELQSLGEANQNEGIEKVELVTLSRLESMIRKGEVTDGYTLAAYTRAKLTGLIG